MSYPKALFNKETLTVRVGNIYKGYQTLNVVQVPPFTKKVRELQGSVEEGYEMVEIDKVFDYYYIVLKDHKPIFLLINPYVTNIRSNLYPLNMGRWNEITDFVNQLQWKQNT